MRMNTFSTGLLVALLCTPGLVSAQSAQSCVDFAWGQFRSEVEGERGTKPAEGNDYLAAHGWIRATQTCLEFTQYPQELQEEARTFKQRVSTTANKIERAIRTNSSAGLFGMSAGAGTIYLYPQKPPIAGTSGAGTGQGAANVEYQMLSQREWMRVQFRLTEKGHDTDGVDGVVGPKTYAAIRRYQRSLGVSPTGVLNSRQLSSLLN